MAKRKTAARKTTGKAKAAPRKAASRKAAKKRPAGKAAAKAAKKASRKAAARKAAPRKAARPAAKKGARQPARKAAAKAPARKAAGKGRVARPAAPVVKKPARAVAPVAGKAARKAAKATANPKRSARTAPIRGAIPSSLGMNGGSSAARSGREELLQHIKEHTETGPSITAGDVDADWQLAYSSGDEAPGGDNPTPDQDVVDEIGEALGINYEDGEELKGAAKIEARDKHRWELDPASKDDFDEE